MYTYKKRKSFSRSWWIANAFHNTFAVKPLARQTCIHRCEMLRNIFFCLFSRGCHLTCWCALGNEESVGQKVTGSLRTGASSQISVCPWSLTLLVWPVGSQRLQGVCTCRNDPRWKSDPSESHLSHIEPSVTQSDDQHSCFYCAWACRRSVSGVSGKGIKTGAPPAAVRV